MTTNLTCSSLSSSTFVRHDVDIFCMVIDNFGDIGVAWRLAKQLSVEYRQVVRLWVDDFEVFNCLLPDFEVFSSNQIYLGINIRLWQKEAFPVNAQPAKLVIETFACELPVSYRQEMKHQRPRWINLEYFSAEDWVVDCHLLPSLQSDGLEKYFFMPSIRANTGGLLREKTLIAQRDAFQQSRQTQIDWLEQYQLPIAPDNHLTISLFSYENLHIASLIKELQTNQQPVTLYIPESKSLQSLNSWLNQSLSVGDCHQQGQVTLHIIPFLPQIEYDKLLWLCDLNFVRGEDSLVRAIWSGKPFIWHIYPTEDMAHLDKLNAFLQHYYSDTETEDNPLYQLTRQWNQQDTTANSSIETPIKSLTSQFTEIQKQAQKASNQQITRPSLCEQMMAWVQESDTRSLNK